MAKSERRNAAMPSAELAELHHDVFSVLIHELGGLSSALALRTDALGDLLPAADADALRSLAEQTRDVSRVVRLLRGPVGDGLLAPARQMSLSEWWKLVSPLMTHRLPRSVRLHAKLEVSSLAPGSATTLTYVLLLAVRDLQFQNIHPSGELDLHVHEDTTGRVRCDIRVHVVESDVVSTSKLTRWQKYASRLAAREQMTLSWWTRADTEWRLACIFPAASSLPIARP